GSNFPSRESARVASASAPRVCDRQGAEAPRSERQGGVVLSFVVPAALACRPALSGSDAREPECRELLVQRRARDAELLRSGELVAVGVLQCPDDRLAFGVADRLCEAWRAGG